MQTHTSTPVEMPVIDSPLDPEIADNLGDDILLSSAAANKVQRVKAPLSGARAWSASGSVD